MNKSFVLIVILTLMIYACGSSDKKAISGENTIKRYIAEIADSVVFERFSPVALEALNPETNELLLFDEQKGQMLVIDSEGNLVSSFKPFVEGPNYMGNVSFGWSFFGTDKLVGFGFNYFYLFSKEGERLQRLAYPFDVGGGVHMDFFPKRLTYYKNGVSEGVVALLPGPAGSSQKTQVYYDSLDLVYALDFSNESSSPIFKRPEQSIYRTIGKYIDSGYPSMDHLKDGKFGVIYQSDPTVYIYDALSNTLINSLAIPEEHQPEYKAVDFDSKASPDLTKSVGYIMGMGDKVAVMVNGRVPESEYKKIRGIERYRESPEIKQLQKRYLSTTLLLFDQEKYLGEVEWKLGMSDYRFFGDSNGYIWMKRIYEDERDYQTFLKIRIVPES